MYKILDIVKDPILTYEQKVLTLARAAENSLDILNVSDETKKLQEKGIICDLGEGQAPYRPRYIVVDFEKFMENGSGFLELSPAEDLEDAINNLLILYKHIPSITSFPVYIGNIDKLLNPYVTDDEKSYKAIKRFLIHIDRTITDSFCHANIGPEDTVAGRFILKASRELQTSIPNITMKLAKETPDEYVIDAINTALVTAKPSFANNEIYTEDFNGDYGIASCYNGLPLGGGSYTLVRTNLNNLAQVSKSYDDFINVQIPNTVDSMLQLMDERIRFLVEETPFFENDFLVKEGLIDIKKFTAMFGLVGLGNAVNLFVKDPKEIENRFGNSEKAEEMGLEIIKTIDALVKKHTYKYLYGSDGKYLLHAQVGLDTDAGTSPGCRIPIGDEPAEMFDHIVKSAKYHKYFPSGIGDVFCFDSTTKNNPQFILDIIRGSFKEGMRYFSPYSSDSDVVRITGYLVKRSEIEKLDRGETVLRDTVALGKGSVEQQKVLDRKVR